MRRGLRGRELRGERAASLGKQQKDTVSLQWPEGMKVMGKRALLREDGLGSLNVKAKLETL